MATVITEECINCGACEPECPNTAIYQGGVEYDWQEGKHAAISDEIFYIVPEKCTECVGFFDQEACAAVCPVDCCIPDPDRPESEELLLERARAIHPDQEFGDDFPSRFRETGGADAQAASADSAAVAPVAAEPGVQGVPAAPATMAVANVGPADFEVPILCRSCEGEYSVAFRYLSPGTILRCPYCGVSFNPSQHMYQAVAHRLDRYAEQMNLEIDRHNIQLDGEQLLFEENVEDVQRAAKRELRRLVLEATEPPKRSIFG